LRSASDLAPRRTLALLALLLTGCQPPIYDAKADPVPASQESTLKLPPPPPLPPPAPIQDLSELRAVKPLDTLRVGDVVAVSVRDEPDLSIQKARISREGTLRLPWLGEVQAAGKTRHELQEFLEDRLRRGYVKTAEVQLELITDDCRKVYVLGGVERPGVFSLPADQRLTLVQVIAIAGGFSRHREDLEADPASIRIIRVINGQKKTFRLSFETIVDRDQIADDIPIEPEDVIYVPPKRELRVFGSVLRPGTFPLAEGSRLTADEVLSLGGGFAQTADRSRLTIIRHGSGSAESYQVNLGDEKARTTPLIQPTDTVIVSDQQVRRVFVLGNVGHPGAFELEEKGLTVLKLIALAGGLNRIADGDAVRLLRTTSEGRKVYRVPINSIIKNNDTENDPVLVPGDVIFVPESFF
jgi:polysaccharide export outer membrane protein